MLPLIHQSAFYLHVSIGSLALVIFWLPLLAKKGHKNHKLFGQYFVYGMYAVSISGLIMSSLVLIDPVGIRFPEQSLNPDKALQIAQQNRVTATFLLMLSALVFCNVKQSIIVLKAKADRKLLKKPAHLAVVIFLGVLSITMLIVGLSSDILLFSIFSAIGLLNSIGMLHYIYKKQLKNQEWIIAHLGNIIGAGIASYTAFFAFGGRRFFAEILTGNWQMLPWVLPTIIGLVLTNFFTRKYRQRYRVA